MIGRLAPSGPRSWCTSIRFEGETEDAFEARAVALREAQLREYYFRLVTEGPFAAILKDLAEQQYEAAVKRSHYHLVMKLERLCEMRDQTYVMEAPNADTILKEIYDFWHQVRHPALKSR